MAEGDRERFGTIEFAIGVPVEDAFKRSCLEVDKHGWETLVREDEDGIRSEGRLDYAEIPHVPNWPAGAIQPDRNPGRVSAVGSTGVKFRPRRNRSRMMDRVES